MSVDAVVADVITSLRAVGVRVFPAQLMASGSTDVTVYGPQGPVAVRYASYSDLWSWRRFGAAESARTDQVIAHIAGWARSDHGAA